MSDPAAKLALDNAILEWKRKHNIRDHDPILANLEILEIYFNHRYANASVAKQPPSYERQTLQLLATDLTAKVRETLAAQHPDLNCRRVVEAVTRRCDYEINPTQSQAETIAPALQQTRGMRV